MQQYSGKEVPLVPGGLRGYRAWMYGGPNGFRSYNFDYFWKPGINDAGCSLSIDPHAPGPNCQCGLYARYKHVEEWSRSTPVFGVIEASGRIILGTEGFRAEKARILAVWFNPDHWRGLYAPHMDGAQVFEDCEDMLEAFPPQDVSELIGPQEPVMPQIRIRVASPDAEAINWMAGTSSWNALMDPDVIVYVEGGPTLYRGPRSSIKEIKYEDGQPKVILHE
jgi:hypothetical protein